MLSKELILQVENSSLQEGLTLISSLYPAQTVFSSSLGMEDQVITDTILKIRIGIKIFTLDTGRLFGETYDLLEKTTARYKSPVEVFFPDAIDVEHYVLQNGVNGFYESVENRKHCCYIRKVKPLERALKGAKVWITGLRAAQSANRQQMAQLEWDEARQLYKYNPLMNWSFDDVTKYIAEFNVPYNALHDKGFLSIGCAPCTRAIEPGEDIRAGRWWWETSQKECGLHQTSTK